MPDVFNSKKIDNKETSKNFSKDSKKPSKSVEDLKALADSPEKHKLPFHTHNPLAPFCFLPDKVNFVNEDPEERVILLLRKHPITNLRWIIIAFILIIAPSFLSVLTPVSLLPGNYQFILALVWYLVTFAFIIENFLSWFFHVNIVTDERIIEVDFVNLIYREVTDANIDQIQDVTVEVGGVLQTVLRYGDILIQTAAEIPKITFEAVPNPDEAARVLRDLRIEEEEEKLEGRVR